MTKIPIKRNRISKDWKVVETALRGMLIQGMIQPGIHGGMKATEANGGQGILMWMEYSKENVLDVEKKVTCKEIARRKAEKEDRKEVLKGSLEVDQKEAVKVDT